MDHFDQPLTTILTSTAGNLNQYQLTHDFSRHQVTGQMPCIAPLNNFQSMGFTAANSTFLGDQWSWDDDWLMDS